MIYQWCASIDRSGNRLNGGRQLAQCNTCHHAGWRPSPCWGLGFITVSLVSWGCQLDTCCASPAASWPGGCPGWQEGSSGLDLGQGHIGTDWQMLLVITPTGPIKMSVNIHLWHFVSSTLSGKAGQNIAQSINTIAISVYHSEELYLHSTSRGSCLNLNLAISEVEHCWKPK